MRLVRTGIVSAIVAVTLLASVPAMADPPPSHNPNTSVFTFACSRGSATRTFQAIAILQSASIAGQLLNGNRRSHIHACRGQRSGCVRCPRASRAA